MVFGRKQKFANVKKPEVEEAIDEFEEEIKENPVPKPIPQQKKSVKELVQEESIAERKIGTIISAEVIEGMRIRTVIISNESIGEVGTSFDLDEE